MNQKSISEKAKDLLNDASITVAIKAKLMKEKLFKATDIEVVTEKGIVTLTGIAASQDDLNEIINIARETENVKNVISKIKVVPKD